MGGWTVLYYIITYPSSTNLQKVSSSEEEKAESNGQADKPHSEYQPRIAGAMVQCPLVEVAADSRPSALVESIAKALVAVAPSLPMAEAVAGRVSDDPRVEEEFRNDRELHTESCFGRFGHHVLGLLTNMPIDDV